MVPGSPRPSNTALDEPASPGPVRGRGRRGAVVAAALGALCLAAALPLAAFLWVDAVAYRYWPADAQFEEGETRHEVTVDAGETFLLWKVSTFDTPDCTATAIPSGEDIALRDVSSDGWTRGAGAVPYVAFAEGRSETTGVSISCTSAPASPESSDDSGGPERYYIDEPHGPAFLDGFGPWWPAPVALSAVGLAATGLAVVLRPPRTRRGTDP